MNDSKRYRRPDGTECSESEYYAREGWCSWQYNPPPFGTLVQITHNHVTFDTILREDLSRLICTRGLHWRMTGIGKEQREPRLLLTEQDREWLKGMQVEA